MKKSRSRTKRKKKATKGKHWRLFLANRPQNYSLQKNKIKIMLFYHDVIM